MKPDMHYFLTALEAWTRSNKWNKGLPLTAEFLLEILTKAEALKAEDKKKLEATTA